MEEACITGVQAIPILLCAILYIRISFSFRPLQPHKVTRWWWDPRLLCRKYFCCGERTTTFSTLSSPRPWKSKSEPKNYSTKKRRVHYISMYVYNIWAKWLKHLRICNFRQLGEKTMLQSISKAGHLVHLERPCVYNRLLKEFLASVTATETSKEWQRSRKELEPSSTKLAAYICQEFWLIPTQLYGLPPPNMSMSIVLYSCCLRKIFVAWA